MLMCSAIFLHNDIENFNVMVVNNIVDFALNVATHVANLLLVLALMFFKPSKTFSQDLFLCRTARTIVSHCQLELGIIKNV